MEQSSIKLHKQKKDGFQKWVEFDEGVKLLCEPPSIRQRHFMRDYFISEENNQLRGLKLAQLFLRFVVKNWEGLGEEIILEKDSSGDTQLNETQWLELVIDPSVTFLMVTEIKKHIELDFDQKKS